MDMFTASSRQTSSFNPHGLQAAILAPIVRVLFWPLHELRIPDEIQKSDSWAYLHDFGLMYKYTYNVRPPFDI